MTVNKAISELISYALSKDLISEEDVVWAANCVFDILGLPGWLDADDCLSVRDRAYDANDLKAILDVLLNDAFERGLIGNGITERDLLDTKIMGALTPRPKAVIDEFWTRYSHSPRCATDWFYGFNFSTDYIRGYRVCEDVKWKASTIYGELDMTINLSKPEKDPIEIAKAKSASQRDYPPCLLCRQNEGYAGRINHPARQNLRLIPLTLDRQQWFLQYSPYVYYNEHCIVLSERHVPMSIDASTFRKLLDFLKIFPEYTIGSNADLPIVGGSILAHDHFQGGRFDFAMARAECETKILFSGFEDIDAGIVKWPMSVIRLKCEDDKRLVALSEKILDAWRNYSDERAFIFSETDGCPHNTITPISRMRDNLFEMDLVLRNNVTTKQHPLGVFHPHEKLHHIKKENIGLIEVMGLAVLPARLKRELRMLADALIANENIESIEPIAKHANWAKTILARRKFTEDSVMEMLKQEVGFVFQEVLEDAGVFKRNVPGKEAFLRFVGYVNKL